MPEHWRSAAVCAGATVLLGLLCISIVPVRFWFERWSYDLPFLVAPATPLDDVIVVLRDEKSYQDLQQQYGQLWDRSLDAQLIDRFTEDGAKLVVFDVYFAEPGDAKKNAQLAAAMRRNGNVIIGMEYREIPQLNGGDPIFPKDEFKEAVAGYGVVAVLQDRADGVVRQIHPGYESYPTLPWAAATHAGLPAAILESRRQGSRWLNYPTSLESFRQISYSEALQQQPGYFSNRFVFIGGAPRTKLEGDQADVFPTPGGLWSGVFIQATAFVNLIRGKWLGQLPPVSEMALLLFLGAALATTLSRLRPWTGAAVAAGTVLILFAAACLLVFFAHRWFSWLIVAGAQIPFALAWSAVAQERSLAREKELIATQLALEREAVERLLPPTESEAATVRSDVADEPAEHAADGTLIAPAQRPTIQVAPSLRGVKWLPPSVPDHTLVRCIGEGGYGQVWLAQDVIGTYHAVKLVYRKTFESDAPYDREFKGIHHFTPISRMHPGFVNILHVGRNEKAGHFFYIMELADDEASGQIIDPNTYSARTLSRVIRKQGRMPTADCIKLGLELSSALAYLHKHRLIHRDIKPSNVLYVHGQAKFADVGLVTQIDTRRAEATYIGTEGYIAPEGPGTAAADVYSLGKVLYEASMGLDRMRFPDLPTAIASEAEPLLMRINDVILKACEFNPRDRYQGAQELHDDLVSLNR